MNLELTPEMAAWAVEYGCFVVDGECRGHCGPRRDCTQVVNGPPVALVALTEPCETCKGDTAWEDQIPRLVDGEPEPYGCGDCEGRGYPLLTVTVPCQTTGARGKLRLPDHLHRVGCDLPDCVNGRVPAFTARVTAVLPVYHNDNTPAPLVPCVEVWDDGVAFLWGDDAIDRGAALPITLPPDTRPGQYVVMCEVVT